MPGRRTEGLDEASSPVDTAHRPAYPQAIEISLTVEQECQLSHIAALAGKGADELAREVLLRGLEAEEAALLASQPRPSKGQEAAAQMLQLREGNLLPEGVTIQDLMREGRA